MSTKMQQEVSCNATKQPVTFLATLSNKNAQLRELGSWVKQHREKANLSQETAAEKAGLSRFQWLRIENGQSGTKRETLIQIARVINADVNKTLRKGGFVDSSPENARVFIAHLPDKLGEIDFSIFDEQEIEEITDFIKFKAQIKQNQFRESAYYEELEASEIFTTLSELDSESAKLLVKNNLTADKNLTKETANALSELFAKAYDDFKEKYLDGKKLATKSKKKILIGKDSDIAEKAA